MKQVVRKGLKDIVVDDVPDPLVTAHHVVVRTHYSLISSGTETASIHQEGLLKEVAENPSHVQKILGVMKTMGPVRTLNEVRAKFSEYAVLGYSGAGVIADKHPTVRDLELGQRVAYGGEGTGHGEMILTGRQLVARIPDNVSFDHACFATLGSIAMNSVRIAQLGIGETVVVIGQGLVGQLVSQLARLQGAIVVATDLRNDRVELAKTLGADYGFAGGGLRESITSITDGRGADCVIVAAAAKSAAPCQLAVQLCRDRGRIVVVGAVDMTFPWNDMYLKEIQLFMSRAYGPGSYDANYERKGQDYPFSYVRWTENRNMEEFLRLLGRGQVRVDSLISHCFALEDAADAYAAILSPSSNSLGVVLRYPATEQPNIEPPSPVRRIDLPRSTKSADLKFALIGAGNLAKWAHLPNLAKIPNASLRAVYSANGARGKSYGLRFKADYCTSDYEKILQDPDIDAVIITSRNQDHAEQTKQALQAGKHVFVEKPMALTEDECRALEHAVEQTGRILTVGFNRRFAPYYMAVQKELKRRSGPAVINCRVNSPGISGSYWMADPAIGGAILGEACHFIDLMYWLLQSEFVSVSAYSLPTGRQDPVGENNIVASFRFADDSIANLTYCTVGSRTSGGERLEVFAQGLGAFTEDFKKLGLHGTVRRGSSRFWAHKGYEEQLADFVGSIREGRPPAVTVRDGSRATVGCLRMLDSARKLEPCAIVF